MIAIGSGRARSAGGNAGGGGRRARRSRPAAGACSGEASAGRAAASGPDGFSRVIGEPREGKGHLKVLSCQEEGVEEFVLQKRDAPALFRELRKGMEPPIYRWSMEAGKIVGGEPISD